MLDHLEPLTDRRPRRWARILTVLTALLVGTIALGAVPVDVAPAGAVTDPQCEDDGEIATDELYDASLGGCTLTINPAYCYDEDPRTADLGTPPNCRFEFLPVGAACNDLNSRTAPDTIDEFGFCGGPVIDGTPCGDGYEAYYQNGVCVRVGTEGTPCDDGRASTVDDVVVNGVCVGSLSCYDGDIATQDVYDEATDQCSHPSNDGAACSDNDATTIGDHIENFVCVPGSDRLVCLPLPRYAVVADPLLGCVYTLLTGPCDDGNPATTGDEYLPDGRCAGTPITCDDGDPATENDVYGSDGVCRGTQIDCNDFRIETIDVFDLASGTCTHASDDGAACDDGDPTTTGDHVENFQCVPTGLIECPSRPGQIAHVVPGVGCVYDFLTGPCDDGQPGTIDDHYVNGQCVGTRRTGPCDDGSPATIGDVYDLLGICIPGPLRDCNDGNSATQDILDMTTGECLHPPQPDGTACNDGDSTTSSDVYTDGVCGGKPIVCDDGNPYTVDTRVPNVGCRFTPLPDGTTCDDGHPATIGDVLTGGVCRGTLRTGPCDDGKPATVGDQYVNGLCVGGPLRDCNDGNPATQDILDMATGECLHPPQPNGTACNDGDSTTLNDVYTDGVCGGTPIDCNDNDPNTLDLRVPNVGCSHTPLRPICGGLPVTVDLSRGQRPTNGNDVILGTSGNDIIDARGGNDVICSGGGNDIVDAGNGNDVVYAGDGNDIVGGGSGDDVVWGGTGSDFIFGERGGDDLHGEENADLVLGNDGVDDIDGGAGTDTCGRDQRRDRLVSCAFIIPD